MSLRAHHQREGDSHNQEGPEWPAQHSAHIHTLRLGFAGRVRKALHGVAASIFNILPRKNKGSEAERSAQDLDVLDRVDTALSWLPAWARRLLTGSEEASEFFASLEGKSAKDVHGIHEAIDALHRREKVRTAEPTVGRNDPCPCQSGKKFKKCCMRKHQKQSE